MVRCGHGVDAEHVDVGFHALPEKGGGIGLGALEAQPVVQQDQVRAVLPAPDHHLDEGVFLLGPQRAAHRVELEERELEVPA